MGKVLNTFTNTYAGAISRSVDDVVISLANVGEEAIAFGAPVFLDADKKGAKAFAAGDGMDTFLGFATRIGVKTPDTYGGNEAAYNPGEIMSIIVRGSVVVPVEDGDVKIGASVYLSEDGKITAESSGTELTNCRFRGNAGPNGNAEVVLTSRNIQ